VIIRILVPKAIPGMGWDVNFNNPKAVRALILTLIIILGIYIASVLYS